jgi:Na+/H+-dicarboxylate symporter
VPVFAVDGHLLLQVVWVSVVAGVGISVLFSLVILGATRSGDARRAGRGGAASLYLALAVGAFALFAAGVVLGVETMLDK